MKGIDFKEISIEEVNEQNIDLKDLFYNKFKSIYGMEAIDILAKLCIGKDQETIKKCYSMNMKKAEEAVELIESKKHKLYSIQLSGRIVAMARLIDELDYTLVPEVLFIPGLSESEMYYLEVCFAKYLSDTINNTLYMEIPHKNETLLFTYLKEGFELELGNSEDRYNVNKTFLISNKNYTRTHK